MQNSDISVGLCHVFLVKTLGYSTFKIEIFVTNKKYILKEAFMTWGYLGG